MLNDIWLHIVRGRTGFDGDFEAAGASSGEQRFKRLKSKYKR